jgi:predicted RNA-binding Zn ribbon-like protein
VVIVTFTTSTHDHRAHGHDHLIGLGGTFDFLNTLEYEEGSPVDELVTPDDAVRWLSDHQLLHAEAANALLSAYADDPRAGERDLTRVRRIRRALREISDAVVERRPAAASAVAEVNRVFRARPVPALRQAPDGVAIDHAHLGDPIDEAVARLAEPLLDEIREGRPDRIRICDNDRCRWVFFDASPTGRRRWCDMASCGNRAKAARHRERTRAQARQPRRRTTRARPSAR